MDCETADNLISARLDRETFSTGDEATLEAHLATCAACREAERALRVQDAALLRAFAPRREAAARVGDRVSRHVTAESHTSRAAWGGTLLTAVMAAAAGFLVAAVLFRPWERTGVLVGTDIGATPGTATPPIAGPGPTSRPGGPPRPAGPARTALATLSLATGRVEVKPASGGAWQSLSTGGAIAAGDVVRTGPKVRCEFVMHEGSQVRLNNDTELRFGEGRSLDLAAGQLWSAVARADDPFRVRLPGGTVTALGTRFDVRQAAGGGESVLTVFEGATRVRGVADGGAETVVRSGERLTITGSGQAGRPEQVRNLVTATRWVHEILLMKGRGNDELAARIDDLFAQIGEDKMAFMFADEVRALGDHCVVPLTRYLQSDRSRGEDEKRRNAAKILSDVAQPWSAGELIGLLDDHDGEVRYHAAAALQRITGQTMGRTPEDWRAAGRPLKEWRDWWAENKERFPGAP